MARPSGSWSLVGVALDRCSRTSARDSPTAGPHGTPLAGLGRHAPDRRRAGARLRRLDRQLRRARRGAPGCSATRRCRRRSIVDGERRLRARARSSPARRRSTSDRRSRRDLQHQPGRGLVRRRSRSPRPTSSTPGSRSSPARTSTTRPATTEIESVDTTDPKIAVVTFKKPFAAWRDLFGGFYGVLPSHILEGKNRHKEMKDGYAWSGGPWKSRAASRAGRRARRHARPEPEVLGHEADDREGRSSSSCPTPRPSSRRSRPARSSPSTRSRSPASLDALEQSSRTSTYTVRHGQLVEALWINNAKFPFDSQAVRQAIGYAIDRHAIVDAALRRPRSVRARCCRASTRRPSRSTPTPAFGRATRRTQAKVNSLMTGDGWTKNGRHLGEGRQDGCVRRSRRPPATSGVSSPSRSCRSS